jgi:hypothetical protein
MDFESNAKPQYEHILTLFTEEMFRERFNNFLQIFSIKDADYKLDVRKFLQANFPDDFERIRRECNVDPIDRAKIRKDNGAKLYEMYLALRKDGNFSNEALGLAYW